MHFVNYYASSLQNDFKGHTTKPENDDQRTGLIQEEKKQTQEYFWPHTSYWIFPTCFSGGEDTAALQR